MIRAGVRIDVPCHCEAIHGIISPDMIRAGVRIDVPCHCEAIHGIILDIQIRKFGGSVSMSFSDMVVGENGLLVELRCNNSFNEQIYSEITSYLNNHFSEWKSSGFISISDAVAIFHLIDELSGGSRFWSEEVKLRVEDAIFEIQEIISALEV